MNLEVKNNTIPDEISRKESIVDAKAAIDPTNYKGGKFDDDTRRITKYIRKENLS